MKKIVLYAHGGSGNHGCEALVRTTAELASDTFDAPVTVISSNPHQDKKYIADGKMSFVNRGTGLTTLQRIVAKAWKTVTGSMYFYDRVEKRAVVKTRNSICFSIGGDNYCYDDYGDYCRLNSILCSHGNKTVFWGCSVEPKLLKKPDVLQDLKRYSLITARESITYEAMRNAGLSNVMYCPDSAFLLKPQETALPHIFDRDVVGINVSPLILSCEKDQGLTMKNYEKLIEYILNDTDMNVALIPHVVWDFNDDLEPLRVLFDKYAHTGRVALVDESKKLNCRELKYVISKCRFLVTARTHASIAAYSTGVPTLVTGYSVKAKGIAKDLFGSYEGYVCPVQELKTEEDLLRGFLFVTEREEEIKSKLFDFSAGVTENFDKVCKKLEQM